MVLLCLPTCPVLHQFTGCPQEPLEGPLGRTHCMQIAAVAQHSAAQHSTSQYRPAQHNRAAAQQSDTLRAEHCKSASALLATAAVSATKAVMVCITQPSALLLSQDDSSLTTAAAAFHVVFLPVPTTPAAHRIANMNPHNAPWVSSSSSTATGVSPSSLPAAAAAAAAAAAEVSTATLAASTLSASPGSTSY